MVRDSKRRCNTTIHSTLTSRTAPFTSPPSIHSFIAPLSCAQVGPRGRGASFCVRWAGSTRTCTVLYVYVPSVSIRSRFDLVVNGTNGPPTHAPPPVRVEPAQPRRPRSTDRRHGCAPFVAPLCWYHQRWYYQRWYYVRRVNAATWLQIVSDEYIQTLVHTLT